MDPILTASETHAFRSFLSQVNYDSALVDSYIATADWSSLAEDIPIPHATPGREALAKATKDLIALQQSQAQNRLLHTPTDYIPFRQPLRLTTTAPPSATNPSPTVAHHPHTHPPQQSHHLISSFQGWQDAIRGRSLATSPPTSAYPRPHSSSSHSLLGDVSPISPSSPATIATPTSAKRSRSRSDAGDARISPIAKRPRASAPGSSSNNNNNSGSSSSGKPALLTASQKKANHIQSEQKRRANIRRGYEALCDTVPALIEAIRIEDAANAAAAASAAASSDGTSSAKKRRQRAKTGDDGEKVDGRAGPRSENVVLGKTVEHIQALLAQRQALLHRLQRARSILPPGHPGQLPLAPGCSLWEREWKGGEGIDDEDGAQDSGDEDD